MLQGVKFYFELYRSACAHPATTEQVVRPANQATTRTNVATASSAHVTEITVNLTAKDKLCATVSHRTLATIAQLSVSFQFK